MKDEEIVREIQKGNKELFGEIIDRYQGKLFGYLKYLVNQSNEETEDLTAEVLIKTYQNLNGFDLKKKFSSWIYRIAHNLGVDYMKRKKIKTVEIEDKEEWLQGKGKLMEEAEIETEEKEKLMAAIGKLETKYKETIMLYYFEDKSYEEISDILKIPTSNVGVLIHRAKQKLQKDLRFMK